MVSTTFHCTYKKIVPTNVFNANNCLFRKVLWLGRETCDTTWEPAENIPLPLIHEFEKGIQSSVVEDVSSTGLGQSVHTLSVVPKEKHVSSADQPHAATRMVIADNEGWVRSTIIMQVSNGILFQTKYRAFEADKSNHQCNTEKDKERLHHRTAGTCI